MKDRKNSCLLIWPPFISISKLPLGIPFLTAYLRNNGIDDVQVIDLNMAYLQKRRLFWLLYTLHSGYWKFVNFLSYKLKGPNQKIETRKARSSDITKKKRSFWKKLISHSHRYMRKKMEGLLDYVENKEKKSIPWSLDSIIQFDSANNIAYSEKIYSILKSVITKNNFSLIGISCIYPNQLFFSFMIAKVIKEKFNKEIYVALGGAQVTKHIDYIINSEKARDFINFFITGDGEEPLARLLDELPEKRFCDIPNLYFKDSDRQRRYERPRGSFHLYPKDFLTPDFMGFDLDIYRGQMPILASKGCFWSKCNFCTYASMQEHKYSISTAEKTIRIIKEMKRIYGISRYRFVDDTLPPRFMKELAEGLLKDGLNIEWTSNIILTREFANEDFCRILKNSGLFQVAIGLESISSRILKLMNKCHKDIGKLEVKEVLANLKNVDVRIGVYIIFGFPTETLDEARQTLDFLLENRHLYDRCMVQPFCLEDNTPMFDNPERFGIVKIHKEDKNSGRRLGCRYEVAKGMTQEEAKRFTYEEAIKALKKANVSIRSSKMELY